MNQNNEQKINSKNLRSFENIKYAADDKTNKLPTANLGVEKKSKYVFKRSLEEVESEQENLWSCQSIGHCFPCKYDKHGDIVCDFDHICDPKIHGIAKCGCKEPFIDIEDICEYEKMKEEEVEEKELTLEIIVYVILALCITFMVYVHSVVEWLEIFPESIWAIFIGIFVGVYMLYNKQKLGGLYDKLQFDPQMFYLFILPPIMFQGGFSLDTKIFLRNLLSISSFAIGATLIASFSFSLVFYYGLLNTPDRFPYLETLQFGCFISAIDPVATISIFHAMHVNDVIYMTVFGESTLNDAVAIALSSSVKSVVQMNKSGIIPDYRFVVLNSVGYFLLFFFVSLLIGWIISTIASYLFVRLELGFFPWLELAMFMQLAYFPYIIAEACGMSGILAILAAGITMRNYAYESLSPWGKITIDNLVETVGYIWENFCFAYLGISIPIMISSVDLRMVLVGCGALIFSRFISVTIVACFLNCIRKERIPFSHQLVMTYGGLRGAVAFYLALDIESDYKDQLVTMTIILIIFTVVGLGGTTSFVLRVLHNWCPRDKILHAMDADEDHVPFLEDEQEKSESMPRTVSRLENFDEKVVKKYLIKNYDKDQKYKKSSVFESEYFSDEEQSDLNDASSVHSRFHGIIGNIFDRGVRGGDMSTLRNSRMLFKQITQNKDFLQKLKPANQNNLMLKKKTSLFASKVERFEGPAIGLPGLTTTKAQHSKLHQQDLDGGFGNLFNSNNLGSESNRKSEAAISEKASKEKQDESQNEVENRDQVEELKDNLNSGNLNEGNSSAKKNKSYLKKLSTCLEEDEEYDSDDNKKPRSVTEKPSKQNKE